MYAEGSMGRPALLQAGEGGVGWLQGCWLPNPGGELQLLGSAPPDPSPPPSTLPPCTTRVLPNANFCHLQVAHHHSMLALTDNFGLCKGHPVTTQTKSRSQWSLTTWLDGLKEHCFIHRLALHASHNLTSDQHRQASLLLLRYFLVQVRNETIYLSSADDSRLQVMCKEA